MVSRFVVYGWLTVAADEILLGWSTISSFVAMKICPDARRFGHSEVSSATGGARGGGAETCVDYQANEILRSVWEKLEKLG